MTLAYLGSLTLAQLAPGAHAVALAGAAGINAALPDILARLAALQAFAPSPVSFSAQLALANQIVGSIQASIALGIPEPSIAAQIAAVAALITDLLAQVASVNAQLTIVQDFLALLGAPGVHAYAYSGVVGGLAGELGSALSGSPPPGVGSFDPSNALVLLTTIPTTWAALGQLLKVSA